jgi:uncharacterized protein YkwD
MARETSWLSDFLRWLASLGNSTPSRPPVDPNPPPIPPKPPTPPPLPPPPPVPPPVPPHPLPVDPVIQQLLDAHNAERQKVGLQPLRLNIALIRAATKHCTWMAQTGTMSHTGEGGSTVGERITAEGYLWRSCGENIAQGQRSVTEVVTAWMNSPGHRANILGQYVDVGFAAVTGHGFIFWCTDFGQTSHNPVHNLRRNAAADVHLSGPLKVE